MLETPRPGASWGQGLVMSMDVHDTVVGNHDLNLNILKSILNHLKSIIPSVSAGWVNL